MNNQDQIPNLLILSSPSGAGKSTLARMLRERHPRYQISVSHTTRKPRPGEQNGREYHFVDNATFDEMLERGEFAEWAHVHTSRYGTSKGEIERIHAEGNAILFDIDWQGTEQLLQVYPECDSVFILPPSMTELARRLRGRKTDDEAEIQVRLGNAREELTHFGLYQHLIRNDELELAFADLDAVVTTGKTRRAAPTAADVDELIAEVVS